MNDMRDWPRNPSTLTGRFVVPTDCECSMCKESIPWRVLFIIAAALASCWLLALN